MLRIIFIIYWIMSINEVMGKMDKYPSDEKIKKSPNYLDGKFINAEDTPTGINGNFFSTMWNFFTADNVRPNAPLETKKFDKEKFLNDTSDLIVTWFGHSSILLKLDGKVILSDPVFSDHASPVPFFGPKKFDYTNDHSVSDLPDIDILLLTHDHYDHLDKSSVLEIEPRTKKIFVSLGVDKILIDWGISPEKIEVADWWDDFNYEDIKLTYVPMRHFSGRGMTNRNATLWGGWALKSVKYNILLGGDSSYGTHFKEIGDKLGPFDINFMECGQYNEAWKFVHQFPEETVQSHLDVKGNILIPVHWGKFKLSIHPWDEPIKRAKRSANENKVRLFSPIIGSITSMDKYLTEK